MEIQQGAVHIQQNGIYLVPVDHWLNPKISEICAEIAPAIVFTRKFPRERRIGDYGRPREYSLWKQETSEIGANLCKVKLQWNETG
jgi:hypothetical protein